MMTKGLSKNLNSTKSASNKESDSLSTPVVATKCETGEVSHPVMAPEW